MPRSFAVTFERNIPVRMRDGVVLYADLYRPAEPGKYPVLLQRTPYDKSGAGRFPILAAGRGYAVLIQDCRGRFESEGVFAPFIDEQQDGYDTAAWVLDQPWSNGRIGMFGGSYVGVTQWQAALAGAPGLETIAPIVTAADYHDGWTYQGGAFELEFNLSWGLGLAGNNADRKQRATPGLAGGVEDLLDRIDTMEAEWDRLPLDGNPALTEYAPYYNEWLKHPERDEFWDRLAVSDRYHELDIPVLNFGGWYDIFLGGSIANYVGMRNNAKSERARNGQRLLIGPWAHVAQLPTPIGIYNPGIRASHAAIDIEGMQLRWYDRWLKDIDNGIDDEPPVTIFVMGKNVWRKEREWPLARARNVNWFFHSTGKANTLNGDGSLVFDPPAKAGSEPDHFLYNPIDPVPTQGGALCCDYAHGPSGSFDQRNVETRADVLCYTSAELETDLEVTGPVKVVLYASSSALDTDFTAKLVDVWPCGCARNIADGIIRARYRNSQRDAVLLNPGDVYRFDIDLWSTSHVFLAGHQIRLEVSSSNFPRFDRNPNHGGVIATACRDDLVPAMQTVFHSQDYPSRLILPHIESKPDA